MASPNTADKDDIGISCPGCSTPLKGGIDGNVGGYRAYCQKCVDAMPAFPKGNCGYTLTGTYPDFKWVEA
ncbi:MAG TPA: hypothetical protein DCE77_11510 [Methylophaga sp.]|jgi:hypothetical protein|uniref:hypothetical protein n=1 Tax=unclassified Methylophaga TaxID=2629249 RepID=UPI000C8BCB51|nr:MULTISPECIES: hypothetical protein [unclassified Methylophaga]MAP27747.1 hypothetical protein [Methylophaga sp.]HAD32193.1 hypothetical protein [Methylophaga sp.]HBX59860.1 hypothetical protein [Methylophaga sp.]|tara:strand:+ start:3247 stop:3456 length:210 start_codon:yes stop_codon:yes gene_type:complete